MMIIIISHHHFLAAAVNDNCPQIVLSTSPSKGRKADSIDLSKRKSRRRSTSQGGARKGYYYLLAAVGIIAIVAGYVIIVGHGAGPSSTIATTKATTTGIRITTTTSPSLSQQASKSIILYVNQGNGVVNSSNFQALLDTAKSNGFNTIFFQVYRSGSLLFTDSSLQGFVASAHAQGLKLFFALYFTSSSQQIPTSIYADGEDGINLDMSTLAPAAQANLLATLSSSYGGVTAVTSTNFATTLRPDMLILETYGAGYDQYIHPGIIASVGVFMTTSKQQYEQEFQYALNNSDGVMVFDYAGLVKAGY
jgi:hypothetical protein